MLSMSYKHCFVFLRKRLCDVLIVSRISTNAAKNKMPIKLQEARASEATSHGGTNICLI